MPKFRKKPVVIEAILYDGTNEKEIIQWASGAILPSEGGIIGIKTLEVEMSAGCGDWIIKGVAGEFYPCKPNIFDKTYEPAE